jgi:hypothetical protein
VLLLGDGPVGRDGGALDRLQLGLGLVDVEVAVGAAFPQLVDQVEGVLEERYVAGQELALGYQRAERDLVIGDVLLECH